MWLLAALGTSNLHPGQRILVEVLLVAVAAVVGFAAGALISRRRGDPHAIPFGLTAGAVCGGICGAWYALVMGVAFVTTYGGAPVSFTDGVLVALAYLNFTGLGALAGGVPGAALGALGGFLVTRDGSSSRRRLDRVRLL